MTVPNINQLLILLLSIVIKTLFSPFRFTQCFVTVSGLFCGRPISCEVPFDISTLIKGEWNGPTGEDEVWEETIHQLASKCLLYDYDVAAKRAEENGECYKRVEI